MLDKKAFGKSGHLSTRVIFGGAALKSATQQEADQTLDVLLQYGVNHLDVAPRYGDGEAEKRIGPWMNKHREQFFLATKTMQRTYKKAKDDLHASLKRLKVDSVDLIQMHNLTIPEEWETALGAGGALEALIEARDQGLTRFIGVTGHGMTAPEMHLRSLERFRFDSVLLPCNYVIMQDQTYAANFKRLVSFCSKRQIAVQTIKSIAQRPWPEDGGRRRNCWYEPLEEQADIDRAVHWVLGNPDLFLISVGDIHVLPKVLEAAAVLDRPPGKAEMQAMAESMKMELIFDGHKSITRR
jgi:aryl-alcohol dehydrogenase-like predicted oxidoreductase